MDQKKELHMLEGLFNNVGIFAKIGYISIFSSTWITEILKKQKTKVIVKLNFPNEKLEHFYFLF